MSNEWIQAKDGGSLIRVRVKPRASKNAIEKVTEAGELNVRLTAPPVENKANQSLTALLAKALSVSRSEVRIVSGEKSRNKSVLVTTLGPSEVKSRLGF